MRFIGGCAEFCVWGKEYPCRALGLNEWEKRKR